MQRQTYITLWYSITDTKCMMAITLSLVALHERVHNDIGLWWWFYNHIRHESWFLRWSSLCHITCVPDLVSFAFSYFFLLIRRIIIFYLLVSVSFYMLCINCFWRSFHLQQRSFAPPKKWLYYSHAWRVWMSARRRMLRTGTKKKLPACYEDGNSAVY